MQVRADAIRDIPTARLSRPVRLFNRLRRGDVRVDAQALLDGIDADFDSRTKDGLFALCEALSEGQLHPFGAAYSRGFVAGSLVVRAQVDRYLERHPEVRDVPLERPLVILGLQRSGTTFLHRLLSEADGARSLPMWELFRPLPPRRGPDLRRLQANAIFRGFRAVAPKSFDSIHFVRPDLADEDQYIFRLDLRAPVLWTGMAAVSYADWLLEEDMGPSCDLFRKVLQILQAQTPGRRFILKNPGHALYAEALMRALPEADFVQTHRDPAETLPSLCKLTFTAQAGLTQGVDPASVIERVAKVQQAMADRTLALPEHPRLLHVRYADLVADPMATVRDIHARLDRGWSGAEEARMRSHVSQNRQHAHGVNRYTLEQFGLTRDAVGEAFGAYRTRFVD